MDWHIPEPDSYMKAEREAERLEREGHRKSVRLRSYHEDIKPSRPDIPSIRTSSYVRLERCCMSVAYCQRPVTTRAEVRISADDGIHDHVRRFVFHLLAFASEDG